MANGFGFDPMFAGQMSCPTCGCGTSAMSPSTGMGYGYPYGGYASFTGYGGMGSPYGMGGGMGMNYPYGYGFQPSFQPGFQQGFQPGFQPSYGPYFGGPMTWGGTYPGMYGAPGMYGGQGMYGAPGMYGPGWTYGEGYASDDQIEEMIYDSIDADPVIPFESDINVDVTGGVVTLNGTVPNKRIKHAVGDDAWWVPGVWDVNNNLQVQGRRERSPRTQTTGKTEGTSARQASKK